MHSVPARWTASDHVLVLVRLLSSNLVVLYSSRGAGAGAHAAGRRLSKRDMRAAAGGGPAGARGTSALSRRRAALNNERLASVRT